MTAPRVLLVAPGPLLVRAAVEAGFDTWAVWGPPGRPPGFGHEAGLPRTRSLSADFGDLAALRAALADVIRTHRIEHVLHLALPGAPEIDAATAGTVATVLRELSLAEPAEPWKAPVGGDVHVCGRLRGELPAGLRVQVETLSVRGMHLLAGITADAAPEQLSAALPALRATVRALLDSVGHENGAARTNLVVSR